MGRIILTCVEKERHFVSIYPDTCSGEPTVDGHGITAKRIAVLWWFEGRTIDDIEEDFPGMNRGAILVACWYQGIYGTRTWKNRWQAWAIKAQNYLWKEDYANCPMPPRKEKQDAI